jgi:hypothetical protein
MYGFCYRPCCHLSAAGFSLPQWPASCPASLYADSTFLYQPSDGRPLSRYRVSAASKSFALERKPEQKNDIQFLMVIINAGHDTWHL